LPEFAIPDYFKSNIHRLFGEKGDNWIEDVHTIIGACVERFKLSSVSPAGGLSVNLVYFADSADYGAVVLKVCFPSRELYSEIESLLLFDGKGICCCYAYDFDLGAILIERLIPGDELNSIDDKDERVRVGAGLIANLPKPAAAENTLPRFDDWISRAFGRARAEKKATGRFLEHIDNAEEKYAGFTKAGRPEYVLHGDLHHTNMLSHSGRKGATNDNSTGFIAIDPKGVVGVREMEPGRFIQNHLALFPPGERMGVLGKTAKTISTITGDPVTSVLTAAFIDNVLSNCWSLEEHLTKNELALARVEAERTAELYSMALKK
jgi:streptomycin 6-kinase